MVDKNVVQDFLMAIQTSQKNVDHTYNATVTRVDDTGIVWVQLAGSDKETPTASTSSEVKMGDAVNVQWRNNKLYVAGNYSNPAAGSIRVNAVEAAAQVANQAATNAVADAGVARQAAEDAQATADTVHEIADNASQYAARAYGNLATLQSVAETLTWITQHGTMTLTTDVALDPTHVYFVQDAGGDYVVGGVTYAIVTEPKVADIGTYYVLSIDESLNNYVGTHLALTGEGLWLIPEAGGNRVLIATGSGSTYTDAGTYIIDENDNISAQFLEDGTTIYGPSNTLIAHLGYGPGTDSGGGTSNAPYYTLGTRNNGIIGNYSVCEGSNTKATNYAAHAEGSSTQALGPYSHAEGLSTSAHGDCCHAEGVNTFASGKYAHAEGRWTSAVAEAHSEGSHTEAQAVFAHVQNVGTTTSMAAQTVIGTFNTLDTKPTPSGPHNGMYIDEHVIASMDFGNWALVIGNGTSENSRSNALTVDWGGNVDIASGASYSVGGVPMAVYIVETGTSGNWTYKKYSDNTFDAWFSGSLTFTDDGQLSSYNPTWYRSHVSVTVPSAIGTVSVITYNFSLSSAATFTMMGYSSASGSTLTQYVVRGGGSLTSATVATCYVHGTWS